MAYRIVPSQQSGAVPVLAWEAEPVEVTAEEVFGLRGMVSGVEHVAAWLEELLSGGPLPVHEVERVAHAAGFRRDTLKCAKRELGVFARHRGFGSPWMWELPGSEAPPVAEDASVSKPAAAAAGVSGGS